MTISSSFSREFPFIRGLFRQYAAPHAQRIPFRAFCNKEAGDFPLWQKSKIAIFSLGPFAGLFGLGVFLSKILQPQTSSSFDSTSVKVEEKSVMWIRLPDTPGRYGGRYNHYMMDPEFVEDLESFAIMITKQDAGKEAHATQLFWLNDELEKSEQANKLIAAYVHFALKSIFPLLPCHYWQAKPKDRQKFRDLGFLCTLNKDGKIFIQFPDAKEAENAWEALYEDRDPLLVKDVKDCGPAEFTDGYTVHDVLMDKALKRFHDLFHLLSAINRKLNGGDDFQIEFKLRLTVIKSQLLAMKSEIVQHKKSSSSSFKLDEIDILKDLFEQKQMEDILGTYTDNASATFDSSIFHKHITMYSTLFQLMLHTASYRNWSMYKLLLVIDTFTEFENKTSVKCMTGKFICDQIKRNEVLIKDFEQTRSPLNRKKNNYVRNLNHRLQKIANEIELTLPRRYMNSDTSN